MCVVDGCGGGVAEEICIILTKDRRERDGDGRRKGGASSHSFNNSEFLVLLIPDMEHLGFFTGVVPFAP